MLRSEVLWREGTTRLAVQAATGVASVYALHVQGEMSEAEAIGLQAASIAAGQIGAVGFNDKLLAAEMTMRLGPGYGPTGIAWMETPSQQADRLGKALTSVYHDKVEFKGPARTESVKQRLDRLAVGEVGDASQWSRQEAMIGQPEIIGWWRRLGSAPCQFCRTMAGEFRPTGPRGKFGQGRATGASSSHFVHPAHHRMGKHPHCLCSQEWVTELGPGQRLLPSATKMKTVKIPETPMPGIKDIITVTKPGGGALEQLTKQRDEWAAKQEPYRVKVAADEKLLAARKAEIRADPSLSKETKTRLLRGDREVKIIQRRITHSKKWIQHYDYLKAPSDRALADVDFDLATSPMAQWRIVAPMPIDKAAAGANPLYSTNKKATVNCGRCVQSYEMRRRGVAVGAKPMETMKGTTHATMEEAWVAPDGSTRRFRNDLAQKTIMDTIATWPPGSRGFVRGRWAKTKSSHVFNVEKKDDGSVVFVEAQTGEGEFAPEKYLNRLSPGTLGILRVDDLTPNQRMVDVLEG